MNAQQIIDELGGVPRIMGNLMYPNGLPIPSSHIRLSGKTPFAISRSQAIDKKKLDKSEFNFVRNYMIYYINAPIFRSVEDEVIDETILKIYQCEELHEMFKACLDIGLDPFGG